MDKGQEIAVVDATPAPARQWTANEVELVKRTIAAEATDDELKLFILQCQRTGLDPFTRQIYVTFVWDKKLKRKKMQIQATIDGFRVVAGRSHNYAGQRGPHWCGADGEWKDVWLSENPPAAAKVGVCHKAFTEPLFATALWGEYAQKTKDGEVVHMWKKMPALMLAKCAEALALRKAFPNDLSGLYTTDEMAQAAPEAPQTTAAAIEGELVEPAPPQTASPPDPDAGITKVNKLIEEIVEIGADAKTGLDEMWDSEFEGATVAEMSTEKKREFWKALLELKAAATERAEKGKK